MKKNLKKKIKNSIFIKTIFEEKKQNIDVV